MKTKENTKNSSDQTPSTSSMSLVPELAPLAPTTIQCGQFTYSQARQCLSDSLIEEVTEQVHITLGFFVVLITNPPISEGEKAKTEVVIGISKKSGWQHAGYVEKAVRRLMGEIVGHYRPKIDAVPIAVGAIKFRKPIFIIEDHNCVHVDVDVRMIVLRASPGEDLLSGQQREITGTARRVIEGKLISGTAYGCLGLVCSPVIPGVKAGDVFRARFLGIQYQKNLCQIRAAPINVTKF